MVAFVRKDLDPDIRRSNFVVILEWLKNLSEKQEMPLDETCVLMLCRIARYVRASRQVHMLIVRQALW